MGIRCTSKAAFVENEYSGANSTKRAKIFSCILENPGCSRGDIERKTGIKINCVSGRVSELLNSKLIFEDGCKHDDVTGKSVNRLYIVSGLLDAV